jgi:hypothetical protein
MTIFTFLNLTPFIWRFTRGRRVVEAEAGQQGLSGDWLEPGYVNRSVSLGTIYP